MNTKKKLVLSIGLCTAAMLGLLIWLAILALPALGSGAPLTSEMTRLRNALLIETGNHAFDWLPGQEPDSFLQEQHQPNAELIAASTFIKQNTEGLSAFNRALGIGRYLMPTDIKRKGGAIMSDTVTALRKITQQGRGYCSDFTQVFNAMAHTIDLPVREWGMSFDGFGGYGHAFNEIYDVTLNKWIFIDTFNSFFVKDRTHGTPLSALEFREKLISNERDTIELVTIVDHKFGFRNVQQALDYYSRGKHEFYLWMGNNALSYDNHPVISMMTPISRSLEQLTAIAFGLHPKISPYQSPENRAQIQNMVSLKRQLLFIFFAAIASGIILIVLTLRLFFSRRNPSLNTQKQLLPS